MIKWLMKVAPAVGSVWRPVGWSSPWVRDKYEVQVNEVREGWVRYSYTNPTMYIHGYMDKSIREFRGAYREVTVGKSTILRPKESA